MKSSCKTRLLKPLACDSAAASPLLQPVHDGSSSPPDVAVTQHSKLNRVVQHLLLSLPVLYPTPCVDVRHTSSYFLKPDFQLLDLQKMDKCGLTSVLPCSFLTSSSSANNSSSCWRPSVYNASSMAASKLAMRQHVITTSHQ